MHDHGLAAAIDEWVEEKLKKVHGIEFSLIDKLTGKELDEEQRAILFRNARELLTNAIKHSRAENVTVVLETVDDELRVSVQDDGIGFDPERTGAGLHLEGGFGLFSIEERMADLGGKLEIKSARRQGCTVVMSMPMNQQTGSPN
jgi:signal transduction histidine kinase